MSNPMPAHKGFFFRIHRELASTTPPTAPPRLPTHVQHVEPSDGLPPIPPLSQENPPRLMTEDEYFDAVETRPPTIEEGQCVMWPLFFPGVEPRVPAIEEAPRDAWVGFTVDQIDANLYNIDGRLDHKQWLTGSQVTSLICAYLWDIAECYGTSASPLELCTPHPDTNPAPQKHEQKQQKQHPRISRQLADGARLYGSLPSRALKKQYWIQLVNIDGVHWSLLIVDWATYEVFIFDALSTAHDARCLSIGLAWASLLGPDWPPMAYYAMPMTCQGGQWECGLIAAESVRRFMRHRASAPQVGALSPPPRKIRVPLVQLDWQNGLYHRTSTEMEASTTRTWTDWVSNDLLAWDEKGQGLASCRLATDRLVYQTRSFIHWWFRQPFGGRLNCHNSALSEAYQALDWRLLLAPSDVMTIPRYRVGEERSTHHAFEILSPFSLAFAVVEEQMREAEERFSLEAVNDPILIDVEDAMVAPTRGHVDPISVINIASDDENRDEIPDDEATEEVEAPMGWEAWPAVDSLVPSETVNEAGSRAQTAVADRLCTEDGLYDDPSSKHAASSGHSTQKLSPSAIAPKQTFSMLPDPALALDEPLAVLANQSEVVPSASGELVWVPASAEWRTPRTDDEGDGLPSPLPPPCVLPFPQPSTRPSPVPAYPPGPALASPFVPTSSLSRSMVGTAPQVARGQESSPTRKIARRRCKYTSPNWTGSTPSSFYKPSPLPSDDEGEDLEESVPVPRATKKRKHTCLSPWWDNSKPGLEPPRKKARLASPSPDPVSLPAAHLLVSPSIASPPVAPVPHGLGSRAEPEYIAFTNSPLPSHPSMDEPRSPSVPLSLGTVRCQCQHLHHSSSSPSPPASRYVSQGVQTDDTLFISTTDEPRYVSKATSPIILPISPPTSSMLSSSPPQFFRPSSIPPPSSVANSLHVPDLLYPTTENFPQSRFNTETCHDQPPSSDVDTYHDPDQSSLYTPLQHHDPSSPQMHHLYVQNSSSPLPLSSLPRLVDAVQYYHLPKSMYCTILFDSTCVRARKTADVFDHEERPEGAKDTNMADATVAPRTTETSPAMDSACMNSTAQSTSTKGKNNITSTPATTDDHDRIDYNDSNNAKAKESNASDPPCRTQTTVTSSADPSSQRPVRKTEEKRAPSTLDRQAVHRVSKPSKKSQKVRARIHKRDRKVAVKEAVTKKVQQIKVHGTRSQIAAQNLGEG